MTDEKKFRTEIPNIIDDLGLDPHERALYVHYKRSCGGNDCEWVESVRVTGQKTKMSHTRASTARKSLADRGLICLTSEGNDGTAVKVIDIWELNTLFYQDKHRPDIDGWTVNQLKEYYPGVNNVYTLEPEQPVDNPLPAEGVNNMNTSVNNVYNKKEHKELLPKGNSGKEPLDTTEEKVNTKGPKTLVKDAFLESSKLPWPGLKKEQSFWWSQFGEIANIFGNDSEKAVRATRLVIEYMKNHGLSIVGPKSIVNLCRQVAGGQPLSNGRDSPGDTGKVEIRTVKATDGGYNV